ncbi:OsmC family protein [Jiella sonneratiae]|uniref:OsmC family protein n=1 Tax=Jiella sonneratiae TaxID=2816856 RepID=A0ABS3JBF3_9HYPH|nr:OsmC family protein [Jiella sonneratiae]MBO0905921.1 OsmC family protein [Jiella sonneratiae]
MAGRIHRYAVGLKWTGDRGEGTAHYRAYSRDHRIEAPGKPAIEGSADPAFRGDAARWNPEEMLLAALSSCHQLWYLHLCAEAGVVVVGYADEAEGEMQEAADGGGQFVRVVLRPTVTVAAGSDAERAEALHHEAHAKCFIARSVNFAVACEAEIVVAENRQTVPRA